MIHLAKEDVKHSYGKFIVTIFGVGLLLGIVLMMMGVYRGMIVDAEMLLKDINVDLWVVQENTLGPFAEASTIHEDLKYSIKSIQGVDKSEAITLQNLQITLPQNQKKEKVLAVGFDVYGEINPINPKNIIEGRTLRVNHYEMLVTDKLGFKLSDKIALGRAIYTVVGITHGTVSSNGSSIIYISLKDAQELQFSYSNKRIQSDANRGIATSQSQMANTVIVTVKKGYDKNEIAKEIRKWKHKSVYTREEQHRVLTKNVTEKATKQIGFLAGILTFVAIIIITFIIYTMTMDKMKVISIMKLIGIPNSMIIKMIIEETLILSVLSSLVGNVFIRLIYKKFPKQVALEVNDALMLLAVIVISSILTSYFSMKKVINADPSLAIGA
jgi:putative ABC transport system permease protein